MASLHLHARLMTPPPALLLSPRTSIKPTHGASSLLFSSRATSFPAPMASFSSIDPHHLPLAFLEEASSNSGLGLALASGGVIAILATTLSLADPQKRRQQEAATVGGDEKDAVRNYFNTAGFDRWRRIYGTTDDVNDVQLDIRKGHAITVEKVLTFLKQKEGLDGVSVCDAGCGTGSLTIPMVLEGAIVSASDISEAMVSEASRRVADAIDEAKKKAETLTLTPPQFQTSDLESLQGKYHTVACIDVLIHYPQEKVGGMIAHLASLAERRLIISFAPKMPLLVLLKRIGELFPGPSKATRAYLHSEAEIEEALNAVGWTVRQRDMTSTKFYYSRLLEAVPMGKS